MTTLTVETTIAQGTYFKRSTGMTGQVIASPELEAKLERVEELYQIVYGKPLGRYAFYRLVLAEARDAKADVGGYLQYMGQDAAGIVLERMHKVLGPQARRKKQRELFIDAGKITLYNLRELGRGKRGPAKKEAA
tara:strand:+ start:191 stop:595 length:405 start_codon:yes stop_codon:yes gene_type:complete